MISRPQQLRFELPYQQIERLCHQYGVAELSVFGSVLRDDFSPESDIDFLATFENDDYGPWMSKLGDLETDLARLLGRKVDVVPRASIEQSRNYIRRRRILQSARPIYVAG